MFSQIDKFLKINHSSLTKATIEEMGIPCDTSSNLPSMSHEDYKIYKEILQIQINDPSKDFSQMCMKKLEEIISKKDQTLSYITNKDQSDLSFYSFDQVNQSEIIGPLNELFNRFQPNEHSLLSLSSKIIKDFDDLQKEVNSTKNQLETALKNINAPLPTLPQNSITQQEYQDLQVLIEDIKKEFYMSSFSCSLVEFYSFLFSDICTVKDNLLSISTLLCNDSTPTHLVKLSSSILNGLRLTNNEILNLCNNLGQNIFLPKITKVSFPPRSYPKLQSSNITFPYTTIQPSLLTNEDKFVILESTHNIVIGVEKLLNEIKNNQDVKDKINVSGKSLFETIPLLINYKMSTNIDL
jgi:hypothetical protein